MLELWLLQTKLTTKLKHFCVTNWRQKGGRGKVRITMHSLKEPLNINKHVIFTSDCRAGERERSFGADYWLIKDQRSIPHNAINKNVFFSLWPSLWGISVHGKCNYLAKLQPPCAPAADHKTSSYSASSTAVPGGLCAYQWPRPSGLCQSQRTGRKGVMSLCRSGKEQRCILQLKAEGLKYQGPPAWYDMTAWFNVPAVLHLFHPNSQGSI